MAVSPYLGYVVKSDKAGPFDSAIYVLHTFQKKSKQGIKTPQEEVDLMKRRLKAAEEDHKTRSGAANE